MTHDSDPSRVRPDAWCRRLRWKSYALDKEDEAKLAKALQQGTAPFFCLGTAHAIGPDDQLASPDRCDEKRACYEEHPLQIRRKRRAEEDAGNA